MNSAPANATGVGAIPAANVHSATSTLVATATRADPNRRISAPAVSPDISAPAANAATDRPKAVFDSASWALISG